MSHHGRSVARYGPTPTTSPTPKHWRAGRQEGLDIFFRSDEAWLRMWEPAESITNTTASP